MEKHGYVYILSSGFKHLYIGITSQLEMRIWQHRHGTYASAFTDRYNIKQLVYFEQYASMQTAIAREKQLKRWSRLKKIRLVVAKNPDWRDLSLEWGQPLTQCVRLPEAVVHPGEEYRGLSTALRSGRNDGL